jgi:MFS family permease
VTALVLALAALLVVAASAPDRAGRRPASSLGGGPAPGLFRDSRLYRLAAMHAVSLGLGVVVANWVVTLLERTQDLGAGAAGVVGALTLAAGIVTRPGAGLLARRRPDLVRPALALSLVAGAIGTAVLALAASPAAAVVGAIVVGLAAGVPFAPAFAGAAAVRRDAPGAAVGFVNLSANVVIVVGTPLLGLAFSLPGDGRIGFALVAALWALALVALPRPEELGAAPKSANAIK